MVSQRFRDIDGSVVYHLYHPVEEFSVVVLYVEFPRCIVFIEHPEMKHFAAISNRVMEDRQLIFLCRILDEVVEQLHLL